MELLQRQVIWLVDNLNYKNPVEDRKITEPQNTLQAPARPIILILRES